MEGYEKLTNLDSQIGLLVWASTPSIVTTAANNNNDNTNVNNNNNVGMLPSK